MHTVSFSGYFVKATYVFLSLHKLIGLSTFIKRSIGNERGFTLYVQHKIMYCPTKTNSWILLFIHGFILSKSSNVH